MLISHDHNFIFLKTRKTAGTSIEMYLQPFCTPPGSQVMEKTRAVETKHGVVGMRMYRGREAEALDDKWFNHMRAIRIQNTLGAALWDSYTRITALRNPFDRMVSYFHWQHPKAAAQAAKGSLADLRTAFADFILNGKWHDDRVVTHIGDTFAAHHIVRYENLASDLADLASALGLDPSRTALPLTKSTARQRAGRPVDAYYDTSTITALHDRLGWMFERGGYPSQPVPGKAPT